MERLQGGIAKLLSDGTTTASLQAALAAVGCPASPDGRTHHRRYADLLARRFLSTSAEEAEACFNTFQLGVDPLAPQPELERTLELFRHVRPLWVQPGAAAYLPLALRHRNPLAMAGRFITLADETLATHGYTLERYLERAWPGSSLYLCVTVTGATSLDEVRAEIRRRFLGGGLPPMIDGAMQDQTINRDPKTSTLR